ncbi:ribosome small subunit-dependent GTPase A [Dactylosporangium aurantiacum]|uniref:Small ribosomal subunit biogenesis GTPase RsgA n=1 Tax=Dactylosporangium aurantiacum TaxID=35754 RepID=A0A9Q9IN55_9ACTN|nr:ribosome small subunit-dependent GTPase A [Dactylosporangium aurantiacum]MDG6109493.1 ribosome small subunit-dependent GTPase A [Dactylosporangium aurantiacum]UWZ56374.1 ribosome small subunit-dependent GTPase A [Dactylosporangium aurantiacum]
MTIDLSALGWDDAYAALYSGRFDQPGQRPARVSRVDRGVCTALASDGPLRASLSGGLLARGAADPESLPCAGDWLVVRTWPDGRLTAEAVLPRRTAIVRAVAGEESFGQVLAANVDAVAVVEPVDPSPDLGRIERLLALAWESGARPVLVLTKCDLAADPEALAGQMPDGVAVHAVSARTGMGLEALRPLVAYGRTLGLLGQSGAGKSSLVNALAGAQVMQTQALRADGRGRHTTTYRALIPMPGGGAVLDTPGVRLVGMFDTVAGLDRAFADVTHLATLCRFDDCRHGEEPGCAVRDAVEDGELSPRRFASWQKLQKEQKLASVRRLKRESRDRRRLARP